MNLEDLAEQPTQVTEHPVLELAQIMALLALAAAVVADLRRSDQVTTS